VCVYVCGCRGVVAGAKSLLGDCYTAASRQLAASTRAPDRGGTAPPLNPRGARFTPHLDALLALLAVLADLPRGDPPHDLGERQPAAVAALADAAYEGPQQAALLDQPLLVLLGGQAPAEAALEVGFPGLVVGAAR